MAIGPITSVFAWGGWAPKFHRENHSVFHIWQHVCKFKLKPSACAHYKKSSPSFHCFSAAFLPTGQSLVSGVVLVTQLCLTLCDPKDYSLPGSSVQGILQERILTWATISFSRGSSWPRDQTPVSYIAGGFFIIWDTTVRTKVRQNKGCFFFLWLGKQTISSGIERKENISLLSFHAFGQ